MPSRPRAAKADAVLPDERAHVSFWAKHHLGSFWLDAEFSSSAPWTVLFGPSGSGKSTILRAIAGLVRPDEGRIVVGGKTVFDTGVWVAPEDRAMRWAAQRANLFPRKTVRENLEMGLRQFGRGSRREKVQQAVEHFRLGDLAEKMPHELSGGERQRVDVIRAAAGSRGRLLLLDEPFAGLDTEVRDRLIEDLRAWLGETPVMSVTHDVGEAFLLRAEVVRIKDGRVVGSGPAEEVLGEERRRLVGVLG